MIDIVGVLAHTPPDGDRREILKGGFAFCGGFVGNVNGGLFSGRFVFGKKVKKEKLCKSL